jgi:hypothetical protein
VDLVTAMVREMRANPDLASSFVDSVIPSNGTDDEMEDTSNAGSMSVVTIRTA